MRIAVVTTSFPAHEGDPAGHFVDAEVKQLRRRGHEVTVVSPRPGGAFGWPGAPTRLRRAPWRLVEAAGWVGSAVARVRLSKPDRIVAHWAVPSAWPIAYRGSVPVEIVSHGADVRLLTSTPASVRHQIVAALVRCASPWRFVSAALRDQLIDAVHSELRVALRRLAVVAPGSLSIPDVRAAVADRRRAFADKRLYVCAGRLVRSKRVDRIIDYVASTPGEPPRVLVVLGDGPERERLERLASRWRMDVRFVGKTTRSDALTWIGAADEVVHASQVEGLSTVVREAEALGVPVTRLV